jgi:hypothetical protein
MGKKSPLADRLWRKVEKTNTCWNWTANKNNKGYGLIRAGGTKAKMLAHRASYMLAHGDLPDDKCVLHKCDNPACVNPEHLFLGSKKDNYNDMVSKGRRVIVVNPTNRPPHKIGSSHGNSLLTEQQVKEIRNKVKSGIDRATVAAEYGIKKATLQHIVTLRSWKHVI